MTPSQRLHRYVRLRGRGLRTRHPSRTRAGCRAEERNHRVGRIRARRTPPQARFPELACFANGVAARCMDGNDASFPGGGGTRAALIAPVLVAAQMAGADGRAAIAAIGVGDDVHYRLWQACPVIRKGFDHPFYLGGRGRRGVAKVAGPSIAAADSSTRSPSPSTPNLPFAVSAARRTVHVEGMRRGPCGEERPVRGEEARPRRHERAGARHRGRHGGARDVRAVRARGVPQRGRRPRDPCAPT